MKPQSAPERALKTISQFQKEIAGALTVSGEAYTEVLAETVRFFAGNDEYAVLSRPEPDKIEMTRREGKEDALFTDSRDLSSKSGLFRDGRFRNEARNDGSFVRKEFRSWILIPVTVKKETRIAIVIARRHGRFSEEETDAAKNLGVFLTAALKDIRIRNKKAASIADETRHRFLLRTQTNLTRQQPDFPGFCQLTDYGACTGSDMGQTYHNGYETFLSCVCDITANDTERQTGLVYLDTWFSILSQTSLEAQGMIARLNGDMVRRTAECYASLAVLKYSSANFRAEIAGTGSTACFYFSHGDMTVATFSFGPAAGIRKDLSIQTQTLTVKPGDILCLCTDGLTETRKANGELFGTEAIAELLRKNYFLSAEDLARRILAAVTETGSSGVNTDDRTLQILKIE